MVVQAGPRRIITDTLAVKTTTLKCNLFLIYFCRQMSQCTVSVCIINPKIFRCNIFYELCCTIPTIPESLSARM